MRRFFACKIRLLIHNFPPRSEQISTLLRAYKLLRPQHSIVIIHIIYIVRARCKQSSGDRKAASARTN